MTDETNSDARHPVDWQALRALLKLTDEGRVQVFMLFCTQCGRVQPDDGMRCQCWNDE